MSHLPAPSADIDRAKGGGSTTTTPSGGLPRLRNSGPLLLVIAVVLGFIGTEIATGRAWTILLVKPVVNALVLLDIVAFGQFGLAILLFTLILRVATLPLTVRSFRSMKEMQAVQPLMQEINKKYKDPKRRQEETMKLYREHKINPLGCALPMVIQIIPFIVLSRALRSIVGGSPESLVGLSQELYPLHLLQQAVPLNQHFLWMDLGRPDHTFIIPILVALSTYVQQRVSVTPSATPQAQQQQQMMLWMMPMMSDDHR